MDSCDTCKNFSEQIDSIEHENEQLVERIQRLKETLRELMESEWMVTHDWGGDRAGLFEKVRAVLANKPNSVKDGYKPDCKVCGDFGSPCNECGTKQI